MGLWVQEVKSYVLELMLCMSSRDALHLLSSQCDKTLPESRWHYLQILGP